MMNTVNCGLLYFLFLLGIPKPRTTAERVSTLASNQQPAVVSAGRPTTSTASKLPVKGLTTSLSSSLLGCNENNGATSKGLISRGVFFFSTSIIWLYTVSTTAHPRELIYAREKYVYVCTAISTLTLWRLRERSSQKSEHRRSVCVLSLCFFSVYLFVRYSDKVSYRVCFVFLSCPTRDCSSIVIRHLKLSSFLWTESHILFQDQSRMNSSESHDTLLFTPNLGHEMLGKCVCVCVCGPILPKLMLNTVSL